eukprot:9253126-Pyramimonas_sp.AAC.1
MVAGASRRMPKTVPESVHHKDRVDEVHRRSSRAIRVAPAGPATRCQGDLALDPPAPLRGHQAVGQ